MRCCLHSLHPLIIFPSIPPSSTRQLNTGFSVLLISKRITDSLPSSRWPPLFPSSVTWFWWAAVRTVSAKNAAPLTTLYDSNQWRESSGKQRRLQRVLCTKCCSQAPSPETVWPPAGLTAVLMPSKREGRHKRLRLLSYRMNNRWWTRLKYLWWEEGRESVRRGEHSCPQLNWQLVCT